jgi:hypothetical protein
MTRAAKLGLIGLLGLALLSPGTAAPAAPAGKVDFAPHRAIYDLKLKSSHGGRGIESVRGRILYDFSGSACAGYELKFRQVSQLESEGKSVLSDLTSTTWEDGAAKSFRFDSQNRMNERPTDTAVGQAERKAKAVAVELSKPERKSLSLPAGVVFPTEHMRRIVLAARAGRATLELPVYDGSENGQKLYDTFTLIGQPIAPGEQPPQDAAAKVPALGKLTRWPVTISYYDHRSESQARTGEQTPSYVINFELYENGISRALVLDYSDFTISGELSSLEMKKEKPCK